MQTSSSYILSSYSFIKTLPLEKILEVGYQSKEGNPIPSFDEKLLIELCEDATSIFKKEDNILEINGDVIIVGDIHGSFHDLLRILHFINQNNSKVLFLGDYVDRGDFSLECITILFALKIMEPDKYFLIRGNHEFDSMCSQYGFKNEILNYHNPKKTKEIPAQKKENSIRTDFLTLYFEQKEEEKNKMTNNNQDIYSDHNDMNCYRYSENLYDSFLGAFSFLPISAIINKKTFCIHGGLSPLLEKIDIINRSILRPINSFEENRLLTDVLWSDPSKEFPYLFAANPRGRGYIFSSDAVYNFLNKNSLTRLIRAHQCVVNGSSLCFDKRCVTVFSASSYSQPMGNSSGILMIFEKNDDISFVQFPPLGRLQKSEAAYYKVQPFKENSEKVTFCFSLKHPKLHTKALRMVTNKGSKIRGHQSQRCLSTKILQKPIMASNSRGNLSSLQMRFISHSVSMDSIKSEKMKTGDSDKFTSKSLDSLDEISKFVDQNNL